MSVSDKGDMQNVQSSGSRGTGLKTTGLKHKKKNGKIKILKNYILLIFYSMSSRTQFF